MEECMDKKRAILHFLYICSFVHSKSTWEILPTDGWAWYLITGRTEKPVRSLNDRSGNCRWVTWSLRKPPEVSETSTETLSLLFFDRKTNLRTIISCMVRWTGKSVILLLLSLILVILQTIFFSKENKIKNIEIEKKFFVECKTTLGPILQGIRGWSRSTKTTCTLVFRCPVAIYSEAIKSSKRD